MPAALWWCNPDAAGFKALLACLELSPLVAQRVQIGLPDRWGVPPVLWHQRKQPACGVGLKQLVHNVSNRHVAELRWLWL
jgi:hypothetical protein